MTQSESTQIESTWSIKLPARFGTLDDRSWSSLRLPDGKVFDPPWPPLSSHQILAAHRIAEDWQIPPRLVPIMGDFHRLICLDYRRGEEPAIIYLNDERDVVPLFDDFPSFLSARVESPEEMRDTTGIIEGESRLDF